MNSGEKLKEEVAKLLANPKALGNVLTLFQQQQEREHKQKYARMRKKTLELLEEEQYEVLLKKMASYSTGEIEELFRLEGFSILSNAVMGIEDTKQLSFLVNDCGLPLGVLKNTLREDNYYILGSFLRGKAGIENTVFFNQHSVMIQIEKFKLLLKIDVEGVSNFMKENASANFVTENIKQNFSTALKACEITPTVTALK